MSEAEHSLFSPSGAHKWMRCTGSLAMEDGLPRTTNDSAEEGTAAHELAAWALTDGKFNCSAYIGRVTANGWEVTDEMAEFAQIYVDSIQGRFEEYKVAGAVDVKLLVENRVEHSNVIGIPDQFGTSDAIFIVTWADGTSLISVEDLKFGYRIVHAEQNEQLMIYALAALDQYSLLGNFTRARMVIHQPRREHISDWECDTDFLKAFGVAARIKARAALVQVEAKRAGHKTAGMITGEVLTPGEKQCQWCKAAGTCPALGKFVTEVVGAEFEDLTEELVKSPPLERFSDDGGVIAPMVNRVMDILTENGVVTEDEIKGKLLAIHLNAMPLVEIWCKSVLSAAESFVFGGGRVPGWKVVAGKKGARSWGSNKAEAEETMKAMRLRIDEMYSLKLVSPTQAEKLLKTTPRRWNKLEKLVVQSEGQPAIVEESDKRPALLIQSPDDDFKVVDDSEEVAA